MPRDEAERLRRLFGAHEPEELRTYLAVADGRKYIAGSTVRALGQFKRLLSGLYVPEKVATSTAPMDLVAVYVTLRELSNGRVNAEQTTAAISRFSKSALIRTCALFMANYRADPKHLDNWNSLLLESLNDGPRERAMNLLRQGRVLLTPQGALVLAKLALAYAQPEPQRMDPLAANWFGVLVIGIHDLLESTSAARADGDSDTERASLSQCLELSANTWFNRMLDDVTNILALYERRWANPRRRSAFRAAEAFERTQGFPIEAQARVAIALWASAYASKRPTVQRAYLSSLGIDEQTMTRILDLISVSIVDAEASVNVEIAPSSFAWNFDTFERYPVLRDTDDSLIVMDPALLLRRCLGWAPVYDLAEAGTATRHGLARVTEDYALEILQEMYPHEGVNKRLYVEAELRSAFPEGQIADAAVDFGTSWVVFELTSRIPLRGVVHGENTDDLEQQIDIVLEELEQISSTIVNISDGAHRLVEHAAGPTRERLRFYPVVVFTEGFPTNPVLLAEIRDRVRTRRLFDGHDVAPVEVIDITELELLESVVEHGGPTIPELLEDKAASSFWSDSLNNYLISGSRLRLVRASRIDSLFNAPLDRIIALLEQREAR